MDAHYTLFDHTADIGIRICANTHEELLKVGLTGLYAVIGELVPQRGSPAKEHRLQFSDGGEDLLFRNFLAEVLYPFECQRVIATDINDITFTNSELRATVRCIPVDRDNSVFYREVKAISFHGLTCKETPEGYCAEVIVDI